MAETANASPTQARSGIVLRSVHSLRRQPGKASSRNDETKMIENKLHFNSKAALGTFSRSSSNVGLSLEATNLMAILW